jgi:hypothetical protein
LTGGLLRFDFDDPRDSFPTQMLICGATDGRCNVSRVPRNLSPERLAESFPECLLRLAPGDDFACRAPSRHFEVDAVLTAKVGRRQMTTETTASCPPPPSGADITDGFTVRVEDEICGGDDPTFRFGLRNPTAAGLTDIFIRFPLSNPGDPVPSQTLICGATNGSCDLRTIPAGTPADRVAGAFPECALRLSPGDDFACRASLLQARVDATVTAVAEGNPVTAVATASCPATPPPTDECAGMVPASAGAGVEVVPEDQLTHENVCGGTGVSDEGGNFALAAFTRPGPDLSQFPRGVFVTVQNGKAKQIGTTLFGGDEGFFTFFGQPSGFALFSTDEREEARFLFMVSHEGVLQGQVELTNGFRNGDFTDVRVGNDPAGGMVAVRTYTDASHTRLATYQRFDALGGAQTDEVPIETSFVPLAVGVDAAGNVLVITSTATVGTFQGRWLTRDGKPLTAWFTFVGAPLHPGLGLPSSMELARLADGSLALRQDGKFVLRFRDAHAGPDPLPAWLAVRAQNQFAIVRGGRGHASWGSGGTCGTDRMEILASSGQSCGCLSLPNLSAGTAVGRDGSVIVPQPDNPTQCSDRLFPQLLK